MGSGLKDRFTEWYVTEYFREGAIEDWVTGEIVTPEHTWGGYLLVLNLDEENVAALDLTFYYTDEPPKYAQYQVAAGRQGVVFFGKGSTNKPADVPTENKRFGLRVKSSAPIIAQFTQGDKIGDNPVTNNMVTHILTPGPLTDQHKVWYYVDSIVLRSESLLEEREWITILNPGTEPARITATFIPGAMMLPPRQGVHTFREDNQPFRVTFTAPAGQITLKRLHEEITEVIPNHHYAVRIDSDVPVTVQAVRRIFERGKYKASSSMAVLDTIPLGGSF
jgi:hypothetical protein